MGFAGGMRLPFPANPVTIFFLKRQPNHLSKIPLLTTKNHI